MQTRCYVGVLGAGLLAATNAVHAKHYFQVYGYGGPEQGETELVAIIDHVTKSDLTMNYFDKTDIPVEGLTDYTLEFEYGITDKWNTAVYFDWEQPKNEDLKYIQTRAVAARYNFFNKGERFFDSGVYFEYYAPREAYLGGTDTKDTLEARIILEKQYGRWDLRLNPIFEKVLSGTSVEEAMEFELAAGLYKSFSNHLSLGLEYYNGFGEIAKPANTDNQDRYVVPVVDYEVQKGFALHAGYAVGLTDASDDEVITTRFEVEL